MVNVVELNAKGHESEGPPNGQQCAPVKAGIDHTLPILAYPVRSVDLMLKMEESEADNACHPTRTVVEQERFEAEEVVEDSRDSVPRKELDDWARDEKYPGRRDGEEKHGVPDEPEGNPELQRHFRVIFFTEPDGEGSIDDTVVAEVVVVVVVSRLPSRPLKLGEKLHSLCEHDIMFGGFEKAEVTGIVEDHEIPHNRETDEESGEQALAIGHVRHRRAPEDCADHDCPPGLAILRWGQENVVSIFCDISV